jgi:hypothetical protein
MATCTSLSPAPALASNRTYLWLADTSCSFDRYEPRLQDGLCSCVEDASSCPAACDETPSCNGYEFLLDSDFCPSVACLLKGFWDGGLGCAAGRTTFLASRLPITEGASQALSNFTRVSAQNIAACPIHSGQPTSMWPRCGEDEACCVANAGECAALCNDLLRQPEWGFRAACHLFTAKQPVGPKSIPASCSAVPLRRNSASKSRSTRTTWHTSGQTQTS